MNWQSIETAPDAKVILLCIYPVYRCFIGLKCYDGTFASTVGTDKDGYATELAPTHWMLIPEPPSER